MPKHAASSPVPPPSPVKPPERCRHCGSGKIGPKGHRLKKLETVRLYHCHTCNRRLTPGPSALRHKTYPVNQILEAMTEYNRGPSLEEVSRRLSSRNGHALSASTISRWLTAHPGLTTYRRLRAVGRRLYSPPRLIRIIKLYHAQVYEFGYLLAPPPFRRSGSARTPVARKKDATVCLPEPPFRRLRHPATIPGARQERGGPLKLDAI